MILILNPEDNHKILSKIIAEKEQEEIEEIYKVLNLPSLSLDIKGQREI